MANCGFSPFVIPFFAVYVKAQSLWSDKQKAERFWSHKKFENPGMEWNGTIWF